ncbi:GNAT family N-acetyltransferase [Rhodovarius crocodyli]|uniref:GNAT family N-acetyltransferase n=1 Tax=Rhodovarius crocodyli TaxID=1979269 RepID=A0A437MDD9_9PROT|nr:GNAT family N-acetyltransferase [Rhodovarius crocodyli]RVT95669.1 GNAT family N-acetyltransferase [Rhodovarius crocodyli]
MALLRQAVPGDAEALGILHVAAWRETYAGLLPDALLAGLSARQRGAMWAGMLGDPAAHNMIEAFVAEDAGALVGFASWCRQRDVGLRQLGFGGEIGAIYLLRSHQAQGLGRALMRLLAQAMAARAIPAAALWVLRENTGARAFYETLGGEPVAERQERHAGALLTEIAYGWRDPGGLARRP